MQRYGGNRYMHLRALITLAAALRACTLKTSPEQNTRHYDYASAHGFDPNFSTKKAEIPPMIIPYSPQLLSLAAHDMVAA